MDTALKLEGVTKRYGAFTAVRDLSFEAKAGSILGFIGPNGAGKTTTLRMILGLITPTAGRLEVLGETDGRALRGRIGFLPEERGLYRRMTATAAIAFFAQLKGVPAGEAKRRARKLLEDNGLGEAAKRQIRALSRGMAQKVQLLSAIAHKPELVILDEPFSGLDPVNQQSLEGIIRGLAARGSTVIFSTHVMQHAERLCDQVVLVAGGRKLFDGTVAEACAAAPRRLVVEGPFGRDALVGAPGLEAVTAERLDGGRVRLTAALSPGAPVQAALKAVFDRDLAISRLELQEPHLHDAFILLTQKGEAGMSRLFAIATREYLAFVRTVGFWLSICLMPAGLLIAIYATSMTGKVAPPPQVAVVDLSGGGFAPALTQALKSSADPSQRPAVIVKAPGAPFASAAAAADALRPYLAGETRTPDGARLDAVVIVGGTAADPALNLWTRDIVEPGLKARTAAALGEAVRRARLAASGLTPEQIAAIDAYQPQVAQFSPKSEAGRVSARDNLPAFVGLAMGFVLYALTLTGAGILLNSVIEEKSNRILEVLLTSASVPEIIGGKILGAAAVTASALAVWASVAGFGFFGRDPHMLAEIGGVLLHNGLIFYFALYFLGGYLMYATLFTTIGAFCETPRDAQTLLGPLMILLTVPIVFMGQAVTHPDAPILRLLSWIPPFTPFLMAARAASGPPAWEIVGTAAMMFALTALELWVAGRAFRTGALASGRLDLRLLAAGAMGRGERA